MSDISHLIRLFYLDSEDQQWRKDMADRVMAQIALLREEHKDYKRRAEAAEERAMTAESHNDSLRKEVEQWRIHVKHVEQERDDLRRQLTEAQNRKRMDRAVMTEAREKITELRQEARDSASRIVTLLSELEHAQHAIEQQLEVPQAQA